MSINYANAVPMFAPELVPTMAQLQNAPGLIDPAIAADNFQWIVQQCASRLSTVILAPIPTQTGIGAVTQLGTGSGQIFLGGAALAAYPLASIVIVATGEPGDGTASFKFSPTTGVFGPVVFIPIAGQFIELGGAGMPPLPDTGVTATFARGYQGTSYIAGDVYSFPLSLPQYPQPAVYEQAVLYFVLHTLGVTRRGLSAVGPLTEEKAGELARSYAGSRVGFHWSTLDLTTWGLELRRLLAEQGLVGVIVT